MCEITISLSDVADSSDDNEEGDGNAVLVPVVERTPIPRSSTVTVSNELSSRLPQRFSPCHFTFITLKYVLNLQEEPKYTNRYVVP